MSPLPTRIGRYELKGLIAQGGMGDLYLARDPNTSRLVILKLLNATLDSRDLRDRFEREAHTLASLSHPNIVHIYDYGDFQGAPFIVMEYIRGETLAEQIKRRAPIPLAHKLKLMIELCGGLAQAHTASIIHRDVKPANLMVDQDGRLRILDFGIARVAGSSLTHVGLSTTHVPLQIGTPGYMSPEQTQGSAIDRRTDIFSAGAVSYEFLSYREAFPGSTVREIQRKVMEAQPAPLASLVPGLNPEIDTIVMRALAKDRDHRFQDAATMGEALERCRAGMGHLSGLASARAAPEETSISRADGACQQSLVAYEEGAREAARRFAIEALAYNPAHVEAQRMLARLDPRRRSPAPPHPAAPPVPAAPARTAPATPASPANPPTAVPTDPTVLLTSVSSGPAPAAKEEVVRSPRMSQPATRSLADEETVAITPKRRPPSSTASEETVLLPSTPHAPAQSSKTLQEPLKAPPSRGWFATHVKPIWARRTGRLPERREKKGVPRRPIGRKFSAQTALIAAGLLVALTAAVFLLVQLGRWVLPSGHLLTITRPVGGTISGAGIECGTRGSKCSTRHQAGDRVELEHRSDPGFQFSGYTDDCAPGGRTFMTGPRTCGARFEPVPAPPPSLEWTLTINLPKGGTILAAGGIECGTLGSKCTANIPNEAQVTLHNKADSGFAFRRYTDECAPGGTTLMTGPRTCGAIFEPRPQNTTTTTAVVVDSRGKKTLPLPQGPEIDTTSVPGPVSGQGAGNGGETQARSPTETPKPVETHEEFARKAIAAVLKKYCAALEAMSEQRVVEVYPRVDLPGVRRYFSQHKSLECTIKPAEPVIDLLAGKATVEAEMKQVLVMKSGGAPQVNETITKMELSRPDERGDWHIDVIKAKLKPKP